MPPRKRIVSLLPAATELACALGLEADIVGISFECDYPASITDRPRVVSTAIDTHSMTPMEIDIAVTARMREGKSLYLIDEIKLKELRPDIILTQDLCQVCAPSGNELSQALKQLDYTPQVIFMSPHSLADIESNLLELAAAVDKGALAKQVIQGWHARLENVRKRATHRTKAFVMEWVDPVYCAGHWLAEMIEIAGGVDTLSRKGVDSVRIDWNDVLAAKPDVLVIAPCGYNKAQAEAQMQHLTQRPGWESIPAVQQNRVYPVDGNAYFVRPGPRIIDGVEMLAELFARSAVKAA